MLHKCRALPLPASPFFHYSEHCLGGFLTIRLGLRSGDPAQAEKAASVDGSTLAQPITGSGPPEAQDSWGSRRTLSLQLEFKSCTTLPLNAPIHHVSSTKKGDPSSFRGFGGYPREGEKPYSQSLKAPCVAEDSCHWRIL